MTTAGSISALKQVVRNTLLSNTDLTDKVGGRIFGAHMNDADASTVDYPMVIIDFRGGARHSAGLLQTTIFEIWTYSRKSQGDALEIYDLACNALNMEPFEKGNLQIAGYAREITRPVEGYNEKARAYYAIGRFSGKSAGTL